MTDCATFCIAINGRSNIWFGKRYTILFCQCCRIVVIPGIYEGKAYYLSFVPLQTEPAMGNKHFAGKVKKQKGV